MEIILEIINLSLPVAIMLFGALFTLLGAGIDLHGVKTSNNSWKIAFLIIGIPTLLVGITSSFLLVYKIIFNVSLNQPSIDNYWSALRVIGILLLALLIVRPILGKIKDRSYKLFVAPVLDGESRKRQANIQIRNIGKEEVHCHALLEKVSLNGKIIDVNSLNPQGWYLDWDRKDQTLLADYAVLTVGIPRVLYLLRSNGKDVFFEFQHDEKSQPIEYGTYSITINFYRKKGKNFFKFSKFEGALKISSAEYGYDVMLEWLK